MTSYIKNITGEINLSTCTVQEACDYAVKKIVEQGRQCNTASGACVYGKAGVDNLHCAVGWLLPLDSYESLMSYLGSADDVVIKLDNDNIVLNRVNSSVFGTLQEFHDNKGRWERQRSIEELNELDNIDTSAPHWQQWLDMGYAEPDEDIDEDIEEDMTP